MEKLGKSWKIFIITAVVLISSIYGYYKINNRNAFEEMYNSYYNLLPLGAIDNMPQIKYVRRADVGIEITKLDYKEQVNGSNIEFSLINFNNKQKIFLISSTLIVEEVYLDINYLYDMDTHELRNTVTFSGKNAPHVDDEKKQTRELLENTISQKNGYRKNQMNC